MIKLFYLLWGASAFQGSALKWSQDHRVHHRKVDTDEDPYTITKGFWFAHMGWLFYKDQRIAPPRTPDLDKDIMVQIQHRYYALIATIMGFGFPTLVGYWMGDVIGGFLILGLFRIILTQQTTFLINSLCHTWGQQTYSDKITARDCFWVALLTHGEGYHNFHHKFELDYRNGIRWYQWDPTKWAIWTLSRVGLTSKLRTVSNHEILKARLHMEEIHLAAKGFQKERIQLLKENIITLQANLKKMYEEYEALKQIKNQEIHDKLSQLKIEIALKKAEFKFQMKQWKIYCSAPQILQN